MTAVPQENVGQTIPSPPSAVNESEPRLLSFDTLAAQRGSRFKTVFIDELGANVVLQKLPASIINKKDLADLSPLVLALTEGVSEPDITEAMLEQMTFEQANAIYEAVEKFNPGVLGSDSEEVAADKRKAFPS